MTSTVGYLSDSWASFWYLPSNSAVLGRGPNTVRTFWLVSFVVVDAA